MLFAPGQLNSVVSDVHQKEQLAVHCNGDGAIEALLDAIEEANKLHPREDHRHRIEHCQMVSESQLKRMKE